MVEVSSDLFQGLFENHKDAVPRFLPLGGESPYIH
jgi:hypothetical protein